MLGGMTREGLSGSAMKQALGEEWRQNPSVCTCVFLCSRVGEMGTLRWQRDVEPC